MRTHPPIPPSLLVTFDSTESSLLCRASSVYVIPVDHTYVGCYKDARGDRDLLMVPKASKTLDKITFLLNSDTEALY